MVKSTGNPGGKLQKNRIFLKSPMSVKMAQENFSPKLEKRKKNMTKDETELVLV